MRLTLLRAAPLLALAALAAGAGPTPQTPAPALDRAALAARVREEIAFSWRAYERYAWGQDELEPLGRRGRNWHDASLLMTPVDAFDTLLLAGLPEEADRAKALILEKLSFDRDIWVKNFEITIRLLGGLLSAYERTDEPRFLRLAEDLGTRLLPAFDSPTGMPYMYVNLRTGKTRGARSNPAEIGTLVLEFGTLSRHTGKPVYFDRAKRALLALAQRRSKIGLVGEEIDVETGAVDRPSEPRRGRDRLVLRVPPEVLPALRRRGMRDGVEGEPRRPERAPRRRGALGPLVRPRGHGDRARAAPPSSARSRPSCRACSRSEAISRMRGACRTPASGCGRSPGSSPRRSTTAG